MTSTPARFSRATALLIEEGMEEYECREKYEKEDRLDDARRYLDSFDQPTTVWAVLYEDDISYGIGGAVVGIYQSKSDAEKVCKALTVIVEEDDGFGIFEEGPSYYYVKQIVLNGRPEDLISWCYIE